MSDPKPTEAVEPLAWHLDFGGGVTTCVRSKKVAEYQGTGGAKVTPLFPCQSAEIERWMRNYDTIREERASSFARLNQAIGGTGLTEYQPEIDICIEAAIKQLKEENARLKTALISIKFLDRDDTSPEVFWFAVQDILKETLNPSRI